jgi:hypothetical protein
MEIKFEQQGLLYVAEFEVASNCNLHIERESRGAFTIAQRGTKQGKYAYITDENYDSRTTIDVDMLGNIYPKYIKITSASKPTYAEVNFAGEGGGGGVDPNDPESEFFIEYFNISDFPQGFENIVKFFTFLCKMDNSINFGFVDGATAVAVLPNLQVAASGVTISLKEAATASGLLDIYNSVPRITKEEFYNLES